MGVPLRPESPRHIDFNSTDRLVCNVRVGLCYNGWLNFSDFRDTHWIPSLRRQRCIFWLDNFEASFQLALDCWRSLVAFDNHFAGTCLTSYVKTPREVYIQQSQRRYYYRRSCGTGHILVSAGCLSSNRATKPVIPFRKTSSYSLDGLATKVAILKQGFQAAGEVKLLLKLAASCLECASNQQREVWLSSCLERKGRG